MLYQFIKIFYRHKFFLSKINKLFKIKLRFIFEHINKYFILIFIYQKKKFFSNINIVANFSLLKHFIHITKQLNDDLIFINLQYKLIFI